MICLEEWNREVEDKFDMSAILMPKNNVKLASVWSRIDECGESREEFVDSDGNIIDVPTYCNNRACTNEKCMDHRLYLYMREHIGQIKGLNKGIREPKAWIFTDCKVRIDKLSREYIRKRVLLLYKILDIKKHRKYGSVSPYSVHMELKLYKMRCEDCKTCNNCFKRKDYHCEIGDSCPQFEMVFLHFHVVSGGVKDLRLVRLLWGKVIREEDAINRESLGYYVSKYANKTPNFPSSVHADFYILLVYKTRMHLFNVVSLPYCRESLYYHVGSLVREIKATLYKYGGYEDYFGIDRKNRYAYIDGDEGMSAIAISPEFFIGDKVYSQEKRLDSFEDEGFEKEDFLYYDKKYEEDEDEDL